MFGGALLLLFPVGCGRPSGEKAPVVESPKQAEDVPQPSIASLNAASALLSSCGDRERRLVMAEDWDRMMRKDHLLVDMAAHPDPERGWDRMLVPLDRERVEVFIYLVDGDDYRSAFTAGDPALRDALRTLMSK